MKLYSRPLSPYCARVRVALYAKSIAFEHVVVEMGWSRDPSFRAISPLGRIPVLELDDGSHLMESAAIVEYLDEAFPQAPMNATTPFDRAKMRALVLHAEHDILAPMMACFILVDRKADAATLAPARQKLDDGLRHVERLLADTHLVHPGRVTLADAILLPVRHSLASLTSFANEPALLEPYPRLRRYAETAREVEPLARVWKEMEEGLIAFQAYREKMAAK